MCVSRSYHTVVQDTIGQRAVLGVLAVQVLADHLDVGLLTHLLCRLHPKADVASANRDRHGQHKKPKIHWINTFK